MSGGSAVTGKVHVLLVEDDASVSDMYRVRLEMDGYRVLVAADGETALRLIREVGPELVLLDYRLPRLDGPAVLRALRADEQTRDQAVVVLSAFDEPRLVAEGRRLGALEWLVKTHITPGELTAVVRRLVSLELDRQGA
jgi:DNA-binding response OmpR family regulator